MSGDDLATSLTLKPTARYNGFIQTSGNLDIIGMEVEGTLVVKLSRVMTHPVRTLLNEVFVLPPKRILLILLCYKCGRRQQGHLGSERAKWVAIWRRRVAME